MIETKTTEQISEDFEYENLHVNTLRDISILGETRWVKVEDIKPFVMDLLYKYLDRYVDEYEIKFLLSGNFLTELFNELSQSKGDKDGTM